MILAKRPIILYKTRYRRLTYGQADIRNRLRYLIWLKNLNYTIEFGETYRRGILI